MKYTVRPLRYKHEVNNRIYGVFRESMPEHPLFIVAPSSTLLRKGVKENTLGLYAGIDLPENTHLGLYDGVVTGPFDTKYAASTCDVAEREEARGNTMLMVRKVRETGKYELVDGRTSGPPYFCLCNDSHGTRGVVDNARITEFGNLYTTRNVPGFDMDATVHENAASELLWNYGSAFWRAPRRRQHECSSTEDDRSAEEDGRADAPCNAPRGRGSQPMRAPKSDPRLVRHGVVAAARKRRTQA